ncbi:MAG: Asp-tRNA(Asn)/Glu-tRNA(Gln) amidotransferase subunit GatC [Methylococcales bacterium]|nr:Asp-tRNA(Asn)/Glu-tRNA(Gln) amidotransferase subunit GatC [Methylococcales bacterium]MDP3839818.1 Asp-tRNA(Asn)/Glu-tRNA(Gln) amidotransferase subunit GatC [Methylococcales bacterium]
MAISKAEVVKVAHLARLAIPEDRLEGYTHTISDILDLVAQMNAVNTDDVLPLLNPLDATQLLRADAVTETNLRELYQSVAPRVEDGLYLVPKVIE